MDNSERQRVPTNLENFMKVFGLGENCCQISVWGDGKHRTCIYDPVRVIINDKNENAEAEVLIITEYDVVRITTNHNGEIVNERTKIGDRYDEFGKMVK